jgi:hypothetical protein
MLRSVKACGVRDRDIDNLGVSFVGAPALRACISGSAFALSPGLTLDSPPFSHFRLNCMWVDDHTAVSAAKAFKHPADLDALPEYKHTGSNSAGWPVKWREPPANVAWYTLEMCVVEAVLVVALVLALVLVLMLVLVVLHRVESG